MGQEMDGVSVFVPMRAIEEIAILGESGEIANAEIAGARGPVFIVRRGFAQIVVTRPHELSNYPRFIVLPHPVVIGQIAPRTILQIVAGTLAVGLENGLGIVAWRP